jgi:hypothetical protein
MVAVLLDPHCQHPLLLLQQLLRVHQSLLLHPLLNLYSLLLLLLHQAGQLLLLPAALRCCRATSLRPWCLHAPEAYCAPWLLPRLPQHQWLCSSINRHSNVRRHNCIILTCKRYRRACTKTQALQESCEQACSTKCSSMGHAALEARHA